MTRWTRIIPGLAVTVLLAACGQGTTDTPLSPSTRPVFDTGGTTLGGNAVDPGSGGSGSNSSVTTSGTASDSTTTSDTGGTTLGGN